MASPDCFAQTAGRGEPPRRNNNARKIFMIKFSDKSKQQDSKPATQSQRPTGAARARTDASGPVMKVEEPTAEKKEETRK